MVTPNRSTRTGCHRVGVAQQVGVEQVREQHDLLGMGAQQVRHDLVAVGGQRVGAGQGVGLGIDRDAAQAQLGDPHPQQHGRIGKRKSL